MVTRPQLSLDDVVTISVTVDGDPVPDTYAIERVETDVALNRIPTAEITLADGDFTRESFGLSDTSPFEPGARVQVAAGYGSLNKDVFDGIVTRQRVRVSAAGKTTYVVTCHDRAIRASMIPSSEQFTDATDAAILTDLLTAAGLAADIPDTGVHHEQLVKLDTPLWDFALLRARALGRVVLVDQGEVSVKEPEFGPPLLTVLFGESVMRLDAVIDATGQIPPPTASAWDPALQDWISATAQEPTLNLQGLVSGADLVDALALPALSIDSVQALSEEDLELWANATLSAARLARIAGRVSIPGNALARPGTQCLLGGLGEQFNGNAYITGVRHVVVAGNWTTELAFGLPPIPPPRAAEPRLSHPARGLKIAKVLKVDEDPKGQHRVQVLLPGVAQSEAGLWVRVLHPYASDGAGITFLPEIDDEVVLAFLDGDPNAAILLGSLHSSARPDPVTPDAENRTKAIVSRAGLRLEFDDTETVLRITTPAGQCIELDDTAKSLRLSDCNGNSLAMTEAGVTLASAGDMTLSATGKLNLSSGDAMRLTSDADAALKGTNIEVAAASALTTKGGQSAELSASGRTTVKGAMVMIN